MYSKIIGHQVEERARSPLIWNELFVKLNIESEMKRQNLNEDELFAEIHNFVCTSEYQSILLAAPLKSAAVKILKGADLHADNDLESINLIYKINGGIRATSTDGFGAINSLGITEGKYSFLIMGHGGTSKSIINTILSSINYHRIIVATRRPIPNVLEAFPLEFITYDSIEKYLPEVNVIINATTLGNSDNLNSSPINEEKFTKIGKTTKLLDVNYNDTRTTKFLDIGKKFGISGIDGRHMNLMQALYAFKLSNPKLTQSVDELFRIGNWQNV